MKAVIYSRVSSEEQTKGDAASLPQQKADMLALVERNNWQIVTEFVDCRNYKATQAPKRGKIVNPSGERADRPQFMAMLDVIRSGKVDAVICWRDDRLMRHPRVAVALEDALEQGDATRNGQGPIKVFEANGAALDRFTMHIKAVVWREENKRRAERLKMAKIGMLKEGRWPGNYNRFGYISKREPGHRGRVIELGNPEQVQIVSDIFNWYDKGLTLLSIRKRLIALGAEQYGNPRKHEWGISVILGILRAEDYCGRATWQFEDGGVSIDTPAIVSREQWERVQAKIDNARGISPRKSKGVYLLQHITRCGECGGKVSPALKYYLYWSLVDGTRKRKELDPPQFRYRCVIAQQYSSEHPNPYSFDGHTLEWAVWSYIVENGIKRPEIIREQVQARQQELITQGDSTSGEIAHARGKLEELKAERAFYQRQAARGKITEAEFDARMAETEEGQTYWQNELERLQELRDNAKRVRAGLDYATQLLNTIRGILPTIEQPPEKLATMPENERNEVLKARRKIIRALCDSITVYADGRVKIEGVIDGSEATQFELMNMSNQLHKLHVNFEFILGGGDELASELFSNAAPSVVK